MVRTTGALWRHADFLKLWFGQAASELGSNIGAFAFDLTAILTLHASPIQMAVLNGALFLPPVFVAPAAGAWLDRVHRRPLLVACDLGRALALMSIPVAALTDTLSMIQLDVAAAMTGALTTLFEIAHRAYLPAVIDSDNLIDANSKFGATSAVAEAGGNGIAGILVQVCTAPMAVAFDALSFVVSAVAISRVRGADRVRLGSSDAGTGGVWEGLEEVRRDPVLRALMATAFTWDLAGNTIGVVIVLFFIRDLHLTPAMLGPIVGFGGLSAFAGAIIASRVAGRFDTRRLLIASLYVDSIGLLPVALAGGPLLLVIALMLLGQSTDAGRTVYETHATSLVQRRVPDHLSGRVNAALQAVRAIGMALGLVAGGFLGGAIGLRATLLLALGAKMLMPLWLVRLPESPHNIYGCKRAERGT